MCCIDSGKISVFREREHRYSSIGSWRAMQWMIGNRDQYCNFKDKTLEGELPDEELCQFLVAMDFVECNSFRVEMMLLDHKCMLMI